MKQVSSQREDEMEASGIVIQLPTAKGRFNPLDKHNIRYLLSGSMGACALLFLLSLTGWKSKEEHRVDLDFRETSHLMSTAALRQRCDDLEKRITVNKKEISALKISCQFWQDKSVLTTDKLLSLLEDCRRGKKLDGNE